MNRLFARIFVLLALAGIAGAVSAAPRAWLDRDRIELGETVTLNIEADLLSSAPDYAPLETDFDVSGHSSERRLGSFNGQGGSSTLYAVALRPRRDGVLTIPALQVGKARTSPLTLTVLPATAPPPGQPRGDVFIESAPDDPRPYVQQSVGWVVRLYSAVPIVSGTLDQPEPQGASFQRVGDDVQYSRSIDGRNYQVVERRFMLIPERSGPLRVPGARFEGRGTAGLFDDMFGGGRGSALQAHEVDRVLQVQALPAQAPQPWLPLHDLELRYRANPPELRQGLAATLTVEAVADGATAAQMPDIELPPIDGVQVFADRAQADERFVDGRPRVTVTRSFSLVPSRAGAVALSGVRMRWWDVAAGEAREARLPPLQWSVAAAPAGAGASPAPTPSPATSAAPTVATVSAGSGDDSLLARNWMIAAVVFAVLWLATLLTALHWRQAGRIDGGVPHGPDAGTDRPIAAPASRVELRKALDTGSFDDIVRVLASMAPAPVDGIDALAARLSDPAQREALEAMQRARWRDGDGPAARAMLRDAFAAGPRWVATDRSPAPVLLPPLYPEG